MPVRVGVGLSRYPFEKVAELRAWLDQCEDGAIDSVWQSDRVLSRTPAPEPLSLLGVVAGATRRLKLGINAAVLGFRDPVTFARQCASLDFLSDGRFLPVVGVGNAGLPAWQATGHRPEGRGARADEALEVMTRLWRGERARFSGEHFTLVDATISPRPVQDPLPLWIGGSSAAAVRRTLRFGSGWLAGLQTAAEAIATADRILAHGAEIGKQIPEDHYGATILFRIVAGARRSATATGDDPRLSELLVAGDANRLVEHIRDYVAGGITKFVAVPAVDTAADFREQTRLLDREVLPAVSALPVA